MAGLRILQKFFMAGSTGNNFKRPEKRLENPGRFYYIMSMKVGSLSPTEEAWYRATRGNLPPVEAHVPAHHSGQLIEDTVELITPVGASLEASMDTGPRGKQEQLQDQREFPLSTSYRISNGAAVPAEEHPVRPGLDVYG